MLRNHVEEARWGLGSAGSTEESRNPETSAELSTCLVRTPSHILPCLVSLVNFALYTLILPFYKREN